LKTIGKTAGRSAAAWPARNRMAMMESKYGLKHGPDIAFHCFQQLLGLSLQVLFFWIDDHKKTAAFCGRPVASGLETLRPSMSNMNNPLSSASSTLI
jgi:hypothetical protein